MPGASAPAAARVVVVNTRVSHHGYAETPDIPARDGFNGVCAYSPRRPGFFAAVTPEKRASRELDASVGASGPYAFTVRLKCVRLSHPRRPPHPAPTFVTMANAPRWSRMRDLCR